MKWRAVRTDLLNEVVRDEDGALAQVLEVAGRVLDSRRSLDILGRRLEHADGDVLVVGHGGVVKFKLWKGGEEEKTIASVEWRLQPSNMGRANTDKVVI